VQEHVQTSSDADASAPWYVRAVPVTALLAVLVVAATLLIPGFRDEVARSTTRQSQPFAELYFPQDRTGAPVVCTPSGDSVLVRFAVSSHLEHRQWMGYQVTLSPTLSSTLSPTLRKAGTFLISPDETRRQSVRLPRPAGPALVTVRLPEVGQRLHARCDGAAGAGR